MKKEILELILNCDYKFAFHAKNSNPVKHLRMQSHSVPNEPGIYFVFSNPRLNLPSLDMIYHKDGAPMELLYFGKAGGVTSKGKIIKQGLNGRLNNVISDSSRNLIDIKRGSYWQIVMDEHGMETIFIYCVLNSEPQKIEERIYQYLDENKIQYPLMNKKRGRK